MVDDRTRWAARQESKPFEGKDLTDAQSVVAKQVRQLIAGFAAHPDDDAARRFDPRDFARLEPDKRNRVILIDGARGSGKTSVLLHLFDSWNKRWMAGDATPVDGIDDGGVIPLRLVDLFPIPPGTHLLMHLIQVFEKAIPDTPDDARDERDHGPHAERGRERERDREFDRRDDHEYNLLRDSSALRSRRCWRALLRTFTTGWDESYLKERSKDLDPEAYTLELEEAERERVELHPSYGAFWEFIDALCRDFQRHHRFPTGRRPLFVVGIDDADMNPARARDLLKTLQLLSHPRVAFILTGDAPMLPEVIEYHLVKEKEVSEDRARKIAVAQCDKVIPRSQRFRIEPLSEDERWARLQESLSRVSTGGTGKAPANLGKLFFDSPDLRALLPRWMRKLTDLRNVLERSDLYATLELLAPDDDPPWREMVVFGPASLQSGTGISLRVRERLNWSRELLIPVSRKDDLRIWERADLRVDIERKREAPPTLSQWLTLVAQVASIHPTSRYDGPSTTMGPYELGVVEGRREIVDQDETWVSFPWPFPDCANALEVAVFLASWHIDALPAEGPIDEKKLLREYLACVVDTFDDDPSDVWELDLPAVVARVVAMGKGDAPSESREGRGRRWSLDLAGLLAAPESGLSAEVANEFLKLLSEASGERWEKRRERLRRARLTRARWALKAARGNDDDQPAIAMLRSIDRVSTQYRWSSEVGPSGDAPPAPPMPPATPAPPTVLPRPSIETPTSVIKQLKEALEGRRVRTGKFFEDIPEPAGLVLTPLLQAIERTPKVDRPAAEHFWRSALGIATIGTVVPNVESAIRTPTFVERDFVARGFTPSSLVELENLRLRARIPIRRLSFATGVNAFIDPLFRSLWDHLVDTKSPQPAPWFPKHHEGIGALLGTPPEWLPWSVPQWSTFAQFEAHTNSWNEHIASLPNPDDFNLLTIQTELVHWYLSRCSVVALHPTPFSESAPGSTLSTLGSHENVIHSQIAALQHVSRNAPHSHVDWLNALWMIATPEFGLLGGLAKLIADVLGQARVFGIPSGSERQGGRRAYISNAFGRPIKLPFLNEIDASVRHDPAWAWFFADPPPPPAQSTPTRIT